jgi:phosphoglycolate phosphatase
LTETTQAWTQADRPLDPSAFELLVFDWDGTLMDSEARIITSMQAAFADQGRAPIPASAVREVIGLGLEEALRRLPGIEPDEPLDALIACYRHHYLVANKTPTPLFEGMDGLIRTLSARGHLLAVATGKSRHGLDEALAFSGLRDLFHATRCAEETFSKPNPAMLFEIMDELGVTSRSTLMIGDTIYDVQMAHNAGVRAIAVGYGTQPLQRLRAEKPIAAVNSPGELIELLVP